jgi:hypothetical protein
MRRLFVHGFNSDDLPMAQLGGPGLGELHQSCATPDGDLHESVAKSTERDGVRNRA